MTRDEIIHIALEAGITQEDELTGEYSAFDQELERFAALIAAEVGIAQWHRGYTEGQAAEREACAQVAEWEPCVTHTPQRIAAAIRARCQP